MIKGREELWNLRNVLERLLDFIQEIEAEELPYFYRCFDTMKNNIEIFFCVGCEDIEDLLSMIASGDLVPRVEEIGFNDIPSGLDRLRKGGLTKRLVAVMDGDLK